MKRRRHDTQRTNEQANKTDGIYAHKHRLCPKLTKERGGAALRHIDTEFKIKRKELMRKKMFNVHRSSPPDMTRDLVINMEDVKREEKVRCHLLD